MIKRYWLPLANTRISPRFAKLNKQPFCAPAKTVRQTPNICQWSAQQRLYSSNTCAGVPQHSPMFPTWQHMYSHLVISPLWGNVLRAHGWRLLPTDAKIRWCWRRFYCYSNQMNLWRERFTVLPTKLSLHFDRRKNCIQFHRLQKHWHWFDMDPYFVILNCKLLIIKQMS